MNASCIPVILAGGLGTRIRHLPSRSPKTMAPVASKPFLSWILEFLAHQNFPYAIISTGYRGNFIQNYYTTNPIPGITVTCTQEPSPLGTAGGFLHTTKLSDNPPPKSWLVLNGDSLAITNLQHFVATIKSCNAPAGILGIHMNNAARYGSLIFTEDNNLLHFREKQPGSGIINAGIYYFKNDILELFPKISPLSFETDVFPQLLQNHLNIKVVAANAPFIDIGTPETLEDSTNFIQTYLASKTSTVH